MAKFQDQLAEFTGNVQIANLRFQKFEFDVAFGDLGSGAADAIALSDFPTGVFVMAASVEILDAFAGEGDLAMTVGDTGDADGLMGSVNLDGVAAGTVLNAFGAEQGFRYEADLGTAGLAAAFAATELDDVTAGSLRVRIYYATPMAD